MLGGDFTLPIFGLLLRMMSLLLYYDVVKYCSSAQELDNYRYLFHTCVQNHARYIFHYTYCDDLVFISLVVLHQ